MPTLSEYSNVHSTALFHLQTRGFQLWYDTDEELYFAERDGWDFAADSPTGLLGLVYIFELTSPQTYQEYWWQKGTGDLEKNLPHRPPRKFTSVMER